MFALHGEQGACFILFNNLIRQTTENAITRFVVDRRLFNTGTSRLGRLGHLGVAHGAAGDSTGCASCGDVVVSHRLCYVAVPVLYRCVSQTVIYPKRAN